MNKISWSDSIWFFDIDDTLIDTAGTTLSAAEGIRKVFLAKHSPEQAKQVKDNFNHIFQLMMTGLHMSHTEGWQKVPEDKSDGRLKMDNKGQFDYDPKYSEALKRQRIELLREKGVNFNAVSIGDPEDKPHPDFFQKGIKIAEKDLGSSIDLMHAIMIGDSFAGDLQTPKEQLGFGLVVLFQKDKLDTEVIDEHQITTGKLFEVVKFLR